MRASVYWIGCVFSVMSLFLSWAGQQEAVDWLSQQALSAGEYGSADSLSVSKQVAAYGVIDEIKPLVWPTVNFLLKCQQADGGWSGATRGNAHENMPYPIIGCR